MIRKRHNWSRSTQNANGTWNWTCHSCGSKTWTNINAPPTTSCLENSGTLADCIEAKQVVEKTGLTYGQPDPSIPTSWQRIASDQNIEEGPIKRSAPCSYSQPPDEETSKLLDILYCFDR